MRINQEDLGLDRANLASVEAVELLATLLMITALMGFTTLLRLMAMVGLATPAKTARKSAGHSTETTRDTAGHGALSTRNTARHSTETARNTAGHSTYGATLSAGKNTVRLKGASRSTRRGSALAKAAARGARWHATGSRVAAEVTTVDMAGTSARLREHRRNPGGNVAEAIAKSTGLSTVGRNAAGDNAGGARARTATMVTMVTAVAVGTSRCLREAAGNTSGLNTGRDTGGNSSRSGMGVTAKL